MALDLYGGPNWVNNWCNSPIIVNASAMEYYKQPMFYVMGHFSKFLIPDSVKVGLTKVGDQKLEAVAFERPDGASVLIAFNNNTHPISVNIADQGSGNVHTDLPANSIQSYIWWH